ncbi:protein of unknown function DUF324 [Desulfarculus baarsii DSM 2075]|uniref:CRISPR type III-associated protein domain-containing protein n=1 Tax=Desulfarculus baarsii (strain ATCC 33931 / DSM 2075 / LMG 7858 / VKM B-1802 / 2st14) TaxID=644282 RepID=E1QHL3_DESB2|nr:RAMP superfamily CRISPR-associated protein [Desulfarculus baarsii]ADK85056.1 protein of unknown function DUF324 [Desulfarculus baarsii DSM 2075]
MLDQVILCGQLEALSPLHVGTGDFTPLAQLFENDSRKLSHLAADDRGRGALVATIVRDHENRPCLSATAIKGCLRAACRAVGWDQLDIKHLFGEARESEDVGAMAKVLLRLANMDGLEQYFPPERTPLPYYRHEALSYIQTRIRVDHDAGVAADKYLFFQEMVPQGVRFRFRAVFRGAWEECQQKLLPALALLGRHQGVALGKGYTLGNGRIRLVPDSLQARVVGFDALRCLPTVGAKTAVCLPADASASPAVRISLRLACEGPFLVLDPTGADAAAQKGAANQLQPLLRQDNQPDLLASSLMGALRARLAWLSQLADESDGDDPERILKPRQSPVELSTSERLFGVTGWRGLVRLASLEIEDAGQTCVVPRVALDRFTAGPIDGALFFTNARVGVKYKVRLVLESRRHTDAATNQAQVFGAGAETDEKAFRALIHELTVDDPLLMLGHGTNQGFGWFQVEEIARDDRA